MPDRAAPECPPPLPPAASARAPSLRLADIAVLAVVALAGVFNLPIPFDDDQGFFTVGARQLDAGALLYRDFWDAKQPGIFWFFLSAGRIAGFNEIGVHAVELAYMLALAVVLLITLRGPAGSPGMARLAAILTVGYYYAVSGSNHLTQVEGLVAFPLFLCMWWALGATDRPGGAAWRLFLSGVAGGVTVVFKLILLPIPAGFWLLALGGTEWPGRRPTVLGLARWGGAVALGLAVPLGLAAAGLSTQGVLDDALWTSFVHPAQVAGRTRGLGSVGFLVGGLLWFGEYFGLVLAFATVGVCASLPAGRAFASRSSRLLPWGLLTWILTAALAIVLQRKWWPYHFLLLFVPLGILAAMGMLAAWRRLTAARLLPRWLLASILLALFLGPISMLATKLVLLRHGFPSAGRVQQMLYAERFNMKYVNIAANVAFLHEPASFPGRIHTFHNPLLYYLARRIPATAFPGSWYENYDDAMWTKLSEQLVRRPPVYILLDEDTLSALAQHSPRIVQMLADCYRVHHQGWYEHVMADPMAAARAGCTRPPAQ